MPQLNLYGSLPRDRVTWTYSLDPTAPEKPPMLYVIVSSARGPAVEHGLVSVPHNVAHEETASLLVESWEAYLFGEPGDVRKAVKSCHRRWREESAQRPPL